MTRLYLLLRLSRSRSFSLPSRGYRPFISTRRGTADESVDVRRDDFGANPALRAGVARRAR